MLFPYLETRRISLRPATGKDAMKIYDILFRLGRVQLPMFEAFNESFGRGSSASFVIMRKDDGDVVGNATLSELSPAGHVRADVHVQAGEEEGVSADANALTANFAFSMWRTRKVYFHSTDPDPCSLGFGLEHSAMVQVEAVLTDYVYFYGRRWDVHILAMYRDQWNTLGVDLLKQIV
ncbi:GNAT family protein [Micromonospora sp. NPDC047793]|uniref:GNAT family N-acetyltransferase n=1 Tax=unclassified Micromonospora TaxID=2617518 RepID=UPI001034622A|nr:GNAT family protein [Verrucosispora sp. SN26_14.1]TBL45459.1 N-acetyltransferase [Verrucosispora sp. SN26_14.1]